MKMSRYKMRLLGNLLIFLFRSGVRTCGEFVAALLRALPRLSQVKASDIFRDVRTRWLKVGYPGKRLWFLAEHYGIVFDILHLSAYLSHPAVLTAFHESRCVLDLGAHVGGFTLFAAATGKKVIAVEAQIGFVRKLIQTLKRNRLQGQVFPIHALVGCKEGVFSEENNIRKASDYGGIMPRPSSLAEIIHRAGMQPDFVKMDIEGSEFALLKDEDDAGVLSKSKAMAGEVHLSYGSADKFKEMLASFGYSVHLSLHPNGKVGIFWAWK